MKTLLQARAKAEKGFTLIELLVVIAIIGILSSVVLASLNSARKKGRDARRVSDIGQLQLALELYYDANGSYPANLDDTTVLTTPGYITVAPTDPNSSAFYGYVQTDSGQGYALSAVLEVSGTSGALGTDYDPATALATNQMGSGTGTHSCAVETTEVTYCVKK
jgi:prepilin-type N-terminal cleavage/methylation domain-containing protein